uniref:ATP synthase F0 subunit 8 n=1 Tax=Cyanophora paradoxa TaxID=2762 RepID=E9P1E4_CYAPA|nr:ATP synthase F0 subunit 8 [Cyanophora paradoxa]ADW79196.1 ATP synthase F0 subunit 8 [Cyanophora paradoxa]
MPQLDLTIYLSQITWFFFCFVTFYLINIYCIIPLFSSSKKMRKLILFLVWFEKHTNKSLIGVCQNNNTTLKVNSIVLNKTIFSNFIK